MDHLSRRDVLVVASAAGISASLADQAVAAPRKRQIFGVSGNFYVEPWEQPVLQTYLLNLSGKKEPNICFLGAATGDNPGGIEQFYRTMEKHRCRPHHLNMFAPHTADFAGFLSEQHIIYVGGGATKNLMAIWRDWEFDKVLRKAWNEGVILSGVSAGTICWFESCITDSLPEKLLPLNCLGFLKGSGCTHYDARPDRPEVFRSLIASGAIASPGMAADNHVAFHYVDDALVDVVTAKKGTKAYKVERVGNSYKESIIEARYIGA